MDNPIYTDTTTHLTLLRPQTYAIRATVTIPNRLFEVQSSAIRLVHYDFNSPNEENPLTVVFHSGEAYEYLDVPVQRALTFLSSISKGTHYTKFIKGCYESRHLT